MSALRVISLVPSATETLLAWGIRPVAVSRFCEQPDFTTVGGTKDPHLDEIIELRPDVVVMCDQENRIEDANALTHAGITVHAVSITHVDHVGPQMAALAHAVGADIAPTCGLPARSGRSNIDCQSRIRAWIPIWKRPWMTINGETYGSSLLERIGVENIAASNPDRYPELPIEAAAAERPDVVLAPSEPYPFAQRHVALLSAVAPVVLVDGQDLFWWGARTAAAAERLTDVLRHLLMPRP